jgi:hypothetical protein
MSAAAITVIELWPPTDDCCVCGVEVVMEYGLAMYESEIVPVDWPLPVREAQRQLEREDGYHL